MWKVKHKSLDKFFAAKVQDLPPPSSQSTTKKQAYETEVDILKKLRFDCTFFLHFRAIFYIFFYNSGWCLFLFAKMLKMQG